MKKTILGTTAFAATIIASPAHADGLTLTPNVDARLRYENVDQPATDADALTMRVRMGVTAATKSGFSALVEAEGTLAIVDHYRAAPFFTPNGYSVVADPENVELNRAQIQYKSKALTLTGGRQRLNIDDQRFVGSVGWRQNEQTFDAVSAEASLGPVAINGTYSWSDRTIFGADAGPRQAYSGDFIFLGAGAGLGPIKVKAFSYLLDFAAKEPVALTSTQTYGVRAAAAFKLGPKSSLSLSASYATQSDYKANPVDYSADYIAAEAGLGFGVFTVTGGYELLGSDNGRAFQTPMATLHKFNGWADVFLTTPNAGLQDIYGGIAVKPAIKTLPGFNIALFYHDFQSDVGNADYGSEWDAQVGFKVGKKLGLLAKYADYDANGFGADTKKLWLQLEYSL
ncbi:MAG: alginate export family protein [Sphingobium sp.]